MMARVKFNRTWLHMAAYNPICYVNFILIGNNGK
jgi:hypothetical protein